MFRWTQRTRTKNWVAINARYFWQGTKAVGAPILLELQLLFRSIPMSRIVNSWYNLITWDPMLWLAWMLKERLFDASSEVHSIGIECIVCLIFMGLRERKTSREICDEWWAEKWRNERNHGCKGDRDRVFDSILVRTDRNLTQRKHRVLMLFFFRVRVSNAWSSPWSLNSRVIRRKVLEWS